MSEEDSIDPVTLLVHAARSIIYERTMTGCWRKEQADLYLDVLMDVLDQHFGGSFPPPDNDDDDDKDS